MRVATVISDQHIHRVSPEEIPRGTGWVEAAFGERIGWNGRGIQGREARVHLKDKAMAGPNVPQKIEPAPVGAKGKLKVVVGILKRPQPTPG